jgi:hypothetical protein
MILHCAQLSNLATQNKAHGGLCVSFSASYPKLKMCWDREGNATGLTKATFGEAEQARHSFPERFLESLRRMWMREDGF